MKGGRKFSPLHGYNRLCVDSADGKFIPCAKNSRSKSNQNFEPAEEHEYPWQIFVESPQKTKERKAVNSQERIK